MHRLDVPEITDLSRVLGRGFQQRPVISHNLRLYAASDALDKAREAEAVIEALELAFDRSEFSRLQVWMPRHLGGGFEGRSMPHARNEGTGYLISVNFENSIRPDLELELRVPLFLGSRRAGRLSLFRKAAGNRLYTDVRLVPSASRRPWCERCAGWPRPRDCS